MENFEEQFEEPKIQPSDEFSEDLKKLIKPPKPVPEAVDKFIITLAEKKFAGKRTYKLLRWIAPAASVAAAVILVVISIAPSKTTKQVSLATQSFAKEDIDHNGRVNILDAMKLDKEITNVKAANIGWDVNKDGLVDKKDVDLVAYAAVRLNKGVL